MQPVKLFIGVFCVFLFFLASSSLLFAQGDEIVKRRQLMESNNDAATKDISRAAKQGNFAEVQIKAKEIMENMDKLLELFPKGSLSEKSRAKPEIWDRWDEFSQEPGKVKKAAQALADAAKTKDEAEVNAKLKALGDACASCHNSFRAPRKKG
jgi:cytochrome c556